MSTETYQLIALGIYFAAMIGIGVWAYRRTADIGDYMLAGRDLPPFAAALSAGASDMSGWLLMGLPGAVFVAGLSESWMPLGLLVGAWLNWKLVAPRLRSYTEVANNSITVPSFLENRLRDRSRLIRIVSGAIILVFFTFYVASGLVSGGVFFEESFGTSYELGLLVVGGVTIAYTLFGGFIAATYTDVVQGIMMFLALLVVPAAAVIALGGLGGTAEAVRGVDPQMLGLVGGTSALGIISAVAWGLGYFGQPHIIVRFMALRSPREAVAGRRINIFWMFLATFGAVVTGLAGAGYVARTGLELTDPEAIFLALIGAFFHPLVGGLLLAAVLAAIMSTVSSQLVVSASALVEDLTRIFLKREMSPRSLVMLSRVGVLAVSVVAAVLAWGRNDTILDLVGFAWAGFGSAFGPTILLALFWRRLTAPGALAGMLVGAVTVFVWDAVGLSEVIYEMVPGFALNLLVTAVVSRLTPEPHAEIASEFADAQAQATGGTVARRPVSGEVA